MKTIKSEQAFDRQDFNGDGKLPPIPPRRRGGSDDDSDDSGRRFGSARFQDVDAGKTAFHPLSGDVVYKKNGKFYVQGGDLASMLADEKNIDWDYDELGPLTVEVSVSQLREFMEPDPEDPGGWKLGPPPTGGDFRQTNIPLDD